MVQRVDHVRSIERIVKKKMEKKQEMIKPIFVDGTFPVQQFFNTLAMILSRREKMKITVTVHQKKEEEKEAV